MLACFRLPPKLASHQPRDIAPFSCSTFKAASALNTAQGMHNRSIATRKSAELTPSPSVRSARSKGKHLRRRAYARSTPSRPPRPSLTPTRTASRRGALTSSVPTGWHPLLRAHRMDTARGARLLPRCAKTTGPPSSTSGCGSTLPRPRRARGGAATPSSGVCHAATSAKCSPARCSARSGSAPRALMRQPSASIRTAPGSSRATPCRRPGGACCRCGLGPHARRAMRPRLLVGAKTAHRSSVEAPIHRRTQAPAAPRAARRRRRDHLLDEQRDAWGSHEVHTAWRLARLVAGSRHGPKLESSARLGLDVWVAKLAATRDQGGFISVDTDVDEALRGGGTVA